MKNYNIIISIVNIVYDLEEFFSQFCNAINDRLDLNKHDKLIYLKN